MQIKPRIRGFLCLNAHPKGCFENVQNQVNYINNQTLNNNKIKNVLIIGSSTGYGLASKIASSFGFDANTIGISFEKEATQKKTGSAGWYNLSALQTLLKNSKNKHIDIIGDAFSDDIKQKTIELIKKQFGKIDLIIYSLASPKRKDPKTGTVYSSVLKPINKSYKTKNLNTDKKIIEQVEIAPATETEISNTVKVMGGEDWQMWIDALANEDLISQNAQTLAYSYIGDKITWPIYGKATIGKAKEDLDKTAKQINQKYKNLNFNANVVVLKALVTQASSAIPVMPLYLSLLYKIMKENQTHEGTVEQIARLFKGLNNDNLKRDTENRLRLDDKELDPKVQEKLQDLWEQIQTDNIDSLTDFKSYQQEFLKLFGFGFDNIDYDADISPLVDLELAYTDKK